MCMYPTHSRWSNSMLRGNTPRNSKSISCMVGSSICWFHLHWAYFLLCHFDFLGSPLGTEHQATGNTAVPKLCLHWQPQGCYGQSSFRSFSSQIPLTPYRHVSYMYFPQDFLFCFCCSVGSAFLRVNPGLTCARQELSTKPPQHCLAGFQSRVSLSQRLASSSWVLVPQSGFSLSFPPCQVLCPRSASLPTTN